MEDNDFVYAVARIRSKEQDLLSASFMEQLLMAKDEGESLRLLNERGWGMDGQRAAEILRSEQAKTWDLMAELMGERIHILNVFRCENDFHNLKAAIKDACSEQKIEGIFVDGGTVPETLIRAAAENQDFSLLPHWMSGVGKAASELLLKTGDGQLCDCVLDRAALEQIREAGEASGEEMIRSYAELRCASGNIKIAVRSCRAGKDRAFMERALLECRSVSKARLLDAVEIGLEAICSYLEHTAYREAVEELKKSASAFERWCDNAVIQSIRPQLRNSFGPGPLAAFVLARENELKTVRIILSGQRNGLPEQVIRERVRETYV